MVSIAQLVRAPDCGSGGRGFESHYSPHKIDYAAGHNVNMQNGLSPSGKAPDFDSGIRWFKSSQPSHLDCCPNTLAALTFEVLTLPGLPRRAVRSHHTDLDLSLTQMYRRVKILRVKSPSEISESL